MRQIKILEVGAVEFKNHVNFNQSFGKINTIKGQNGEGKTSIGEMVSWIIGGVDMMGNKLDPTPTDRETEKTSAYVIFQVDDKSIKLVRELVKGKAAYEINDAPKKATEFNEVVYSLTGSNSIDMFMSLFNPSYFPAMHWQDQRNMLFQYVTVPLNAEVFKELPKLQSDKLKVCFKKNNITDLENIHKKNKTTKEKELIAAKSRVQTLEGQLEGVEPQDLVKLQSEHADAVLAFNDAEHELNKYKEAERKLFKLGNDRDTILRNIDAIKVKAAKLKVQTECAACDQILSDDTKKVAHGILNTEYKDLKKLYEGTLVKITEIELPELGDYQAINENRIRLQMAIQAEQNRLKAVEVIDAAKQAVIDVQTSLNESIFILDAIKAFKGKEADLQADKAKALFKNLSLRLWDIPASGEKKPAFEIELNDKPYRKLSLGEKARAGLELISVLSQQSEMLVPTFIDNAESITNDIPTTHQLISAYAVSVVYGVDGNVLYDGKLTIETRKDDLITVDCEVI